MTIKLVLDEELHLSRLGVRYLYDTLLERRIPMNDPGCARAYSMLSSRLQVLGTDLGFEFAEGFEHLCAISLWIHE